MGEVEAVKDEGIPIAGEHDAEAKRMGWVEQEKFKGDTDRWVDAEKFLERGKNELPIMRERLKKYDSTIKNLNTKVSKMTDTFKEFRSYAQDREQKSVERAIKDLTKKQRSAVEDGDTDTFDKIEEEKKDLLQEKITVPEVNTDDVLQEELDEWISDGNEWFNKNSELGDYATSVSSYIAKRTNKTGKAFYDEVKEEVMRKFPDEFDKKVEPTTNAVESGTEQATPPKGKQNYASLPAGEKAACDRFCKEIPGFTKEEYLKSYEW